MKILTDFHSSSRQMTGQATTIFIYICLSPSSKCIVLFDVAKKVRSEGLTEMTAKYCLLDEMQYNLAGIYQRLGLMYCLHLTTYPKYGGSMFHKTLTPLYQHTCCHIPDDSNFQGKHTFLSAVRCRKLQKLCTFLSLLQYQFSGLYSKTC